MEAPSRIPPQVQDILSAWNLKALEFEPGSTPTVADAARTIGVLPAQIAKSLLFRDKDGKYHLIVCAGDRRISSARLKSLAGSKLSMTTAEETREVTGYLPGGVCPFGVTGASVYIDDSLSGLGTVYPAAGTDSSGVPTTYAQLLEITGGLSCSVTE